MTKKILLAAVIASTALATVSADCTSSFEGAYAGLGLSATQNKSKTTLKNNGVELLNRTQSKVGPSISIVGGYNVEFAPMHLVGIEAAVTYTKAKVENTDTIGNATYRTTFEKDWGSYLNLRYGYKVTNDAALFVGIAAELNRYKTDIKRDGVDDQFSSKKTKFAIAPNLGAEFNLSKDMFAGVRYTYSMASKIDYKEGTADLNIKPSSHTATVFLGYRF